ncbi:MAG: SDR family NAD(P)-dependent oxidoreductase [Cytophagales bacterium]|nr:SDR family NAD(P)-dependent oxidoreductase [Cytophagales bacterium]
MRIHKNKVLITGATAGIGKALTETFLKLDNQVIAIGRNQEKLNELARGDSKIIPFQCDVSNQNELDKLTLFIEQHHQNLNIIINNAEIQYNYDFMKESQLLHKVEHEINVNLLAPLKLITLLLPTLQNNQNTAIVNVSSGLALVPKMDAPVYCGTKAGIHIFSKSLRYQLEAYNIKVFEIIPPLVDTAMVAGRGKGKISPQALANEFIIAFKKNKYEVNIGKVKLLRFINRLFPSLAEKLMKGGK